MLSQYDTSDTNNTSDLFDMATDFSDPLDNSQQTQSSTSTNPQQNLYQSRVNYIPQTRPQISPYQTPNLQRIPTMPTSTIVRSTNVISNGIQQQQQQTIYTQQQMMNTSRPVYPRMPNPQQQTVSSPLIRQQYNPSGMVSMNQNVTQMNIVKASDPNNNNVFVTNSQQQQPTLVGLQPQHTVTQGNKPISTGLPSLNSQQQQQLNQYQVQMQQQQNSIQPYNIRVCSIDEILQILHCSSFRLNRWIRTAQILRITCSQIRANNNKQFHHLHPQLILLNNNNNNSILKFNENNSFKNNLFYYYMHINVNNVKNKLSTVKHVQVHVHYHIVVL
jgi:hypothetical protein